MHKECVERVFLRVCEGVCIERVHVSGSVYKGVLCLQVVCVQGVCVQGVCEGCSVCVRECVVCEVCEKREYVQRCSVFPSGV